MCVSRGWEIKVHDPFVNKFKYFLDKDIEKILTFADIVVIITDHDFYREVNFSSNIVLDTRNMNIKAKEYHLLGKGE